MDSVIYDVTIIGTRPLLMHSGELADPLSPKAKRLKEAVESNKGKNATDAGHEEVARREFLGGLYYDEEAGPIVESITIEAMMKNGAAMSRKGKQMTAGVECDQDFYPLEYDGPRDRDELWEFRGPNDTRPFSDRRLVRVQQARIIRCRPRFPKGWKVSFGVRIHEVAKVNPSDVQKAIENAGYLVGMFDFRPRFGLFEIDRFEKRVEGKKKTALQTLRGEVRFGEIGPGAVWQAKARRGKARALQRADGVTAPAYQILLAVSLQRPSQPNRGSQST